MGIRPAKAIEALRALKEEGGTPQVMAGGQALTAWKNKVRGVIESSLGANNSLLKELDNVRYTLSAWSPSTPDYEWDRARQRGIKNTVGLVDAAVFQLELATEGDDVIDDSSFDPELWAHVANLVADQDWSKVAAQAAIYVEDRLKRWAGIPRDKNGDPLYGRALYSNVLGAKSSFILGGRSGESDGWLMLGMGFAQALGNVDRHNIQDRPDVRRYAIGVLGVASLLLTQLRYEHPELIRDAESASTP